MIENWVKSVIDDYAKNGVPLCNFLLAVLANDLYEVTQQVSEARLVSEVEFCNLIDICRYVHDNTPVTCHGSKEKVERWIKMHK